MMSAIAMAGIMGMTSCTDYLNKAPESDYQDNDPYKNFMNFQGFTEELYNCIPVVSNNKDAGHTCFNYGEDEYWEPQECVCKPVVWTTETSGPGLLFTMVTRTIKARQVQTTELIKVTYGPTPGMPSVKPISVSPTSAI